MNVGVIGTGLMGLPMAQRVLQAGLSLTVYNRTTAKLEPLRQAGATIASSPEALIRDCTAIVLMLTNADAIRSVLFESARTELAGKTIIQMSTIAPTESKAIQSEVTAAGGDYLEAPVLGSTPEATDGKLIVMVGGTEEQFDRWLDLLKCFGPEPRLLGPVGSASAVKLALNQLIGSLTAAFGASLGFVVQQGVDAEAFMQILRGSALYAPTFDKKLQRMLDRNFANPNFPTKHLLKDMRLFRTEADSLGLDARTIAAVEEILNQTIDLDLADADYSALFSAIVPPS
ncbi:NAD(P)-dependent oxidoreductase [Leptolyngbya sp. FACHB-36]|uniref:NAD(P)-dependent oxidoreductase n=1 Tax=Leptolyngbya sp. FACHB-36 TaxID=2692808 RepID=UPI0016813DDA|nr:NAD(P)-dependent oxidoreductase [Leptolyngbya sp. FACHB-36]MBD2019134.1 NAD(P)-dependent oxidoreductase [Leptolyngbya sp. FACHB-36]